MIGSVLVNKLISYRDSGVLFACNVIFKRVCYGIDFGLFVTLFYQKRNL